MGENVRGNSSAHPLVHFLGGGLAGITSASATYPLDLVRTRLAAQVTWYFCELRENHQRYFSNLFFFHGMSGLDIIYIWLIELNPICQYFLFTLTLFIETYILFLCREVPCTTEASHMLSVPSVETKVSWVCTRGLEQHCWYIHNVLLLYFYHAMFLLLT